MIDLLGRIVEFFVCWIQTGIVLFINLLATALGAVWEAIVDQLPDLPDYPELPSWAADSVALVHELVDVPWIISYMITFLTSFLLLLGFMALLRWLKATD